jgi:hypothetical protein
MEIKINTITSMPVKSQIMRISLASWMRSNINTEQRQNSLQDSRDADQYHEQFEQLRQSTITGKLVYRPEADGADNNNNQTPIKAESIAIHLLP